MICADKRSSLLSRRAVATQFRQTAVTAKEGETRGTPLRRKSEQTKLVTAIAKTKKVTEDKDEGEVCIYLYSQFLFPNCSIYIF